MKKTDTILSKFTNCCLLTCCKSSTTPNNVRSSKHTLSARSSSNRKPSKNSVCSLFACCKRRRTHHTRKRRTYKASKRTIELARPKLPRNKYVAPTYTSHPITIKRSKLKKPSKRTEELALPYVRTLLAAKRDYRWILKRRRLRLMDGYVDKSLRTTYSRLSHVKDSRKKKGACWCLFRKKSALNYSITPRQADMALPYVRILLETRKEFKDVLDERQYANLNANLKKSMKCMYSKMWHTVPPKPKKKASCFSILCRRKSGYKLSKRLDQLAIPPVRHLVYSKQAFRSVLAAKKMQTLDKHIVTSLATRYSRLGNVQAPPKHVPKAKWSPEERQRHEEWLHRRAQPKRDFYEIDLT